MAIAYKMDKIVNLSTQVPKVNSSNDWTRLEIEYSITRPAPTIQPYILCHDGVYIDYDVIGLTFFLWRQRVWVKSAMCGPQTHDVNKSWLQVARSN